MAPPRPRQNDQPGLTRRSLFQASTAALLLGSSGAPARSDQGREQGRDAAPADCEWRNRQPDMAYRRLGRTGLMISEVVSGGDPITPDNYKHLDVALERGLNYLDMAPAYHDGKTEEAYGKLLGGSSSRRQKVFLTTKISGVDQLRERLYREILEGLPESKQEAIRKRAQELRTRRGVDEPGYFLTYFPGQQRGFDNAYLRLAMMPEYADRVESSPKLREHITRSLEESLKRVGTDHFDIVMCPHGANTPEDVQGDEYVGAFEQLKQQGKVRFLGVSAHNDPAGVLRSAVDSGHYDLAMIAYNVINGGYVEEAIRHAAEADFGVIAMKSAMAVATHHESLQPVPRWRIDKVDRIVPGDMKAPLKAYTWSLQNPNISAVISNLWDETHVEENLSVAGKKVDLQPA